jgi:methanogenic corrinoid protein MtbC1
MMVPLKVCTLSEKIAITYLTVSDLYIMPAQRSVVQMLQFPDDNTPEGRKRLMVQLRQNQSELEKQAKTATSEIVKLVQKDQKQFVNQIMARAQALTQGLEPLISSITQPSKAFQHSNRMSRD